GSAAIGYSRCASRRDVRSPLPQGGRRHDLRRLQRDPARDRRRTPASPAAEPDQSVRSDVFDLLINAEVIVDDVAVAERVFVEALGFPEPRPSWSGKVPGYGFTWLFARVHPSLKVSPTRIEAMAVAPLDPAIDPRLTIPFLPQLLAAQGDRPW